MRALAIPMALLLGCTPEEPTPDHMDVTVTSAEDSSSESESGTPPDLPTDDGNWGIKLDVGPPYYSGTGEESMT